MDMHIIAHVPLTSTSSAYCVRHREAERGDIDALFAELDASLALSRSVHDELVGPRAAQRLQERLQVGRGEV
jgi:hypothetical protein